ncbi:hypothetical protein AMTR_s00030p00242200 [Amborella trichopoda]|uniref:F-box domain-containing protein n=1 Tax=Amborella trichopoda TaxID=13333 RepID=U5D761_AMBTC|nr:hypothetical protein AMTR_s00030p00242200 [Amborella trichopoda]
MALEIDRISSLSNDILHHILSHLPIREVGRTSILSKRWRDDWAFTLYFNVVKDRTPGFLANKYEWFTRIDWALLFHTENIHGFLVDVTQNPDHIDCWVNYLSRKDVQELTMEFVTDEYVDYAFHRSFFFCTCSLSPPSGFNPPSGFKGSSL